MNMVMMLFSLLKRMGNAYVSLANSANSEGDSHWAPMYLNDEFGVDSGQFRIESSAI